MNNHSEISLERLDTAISVISSFCSNIDDIINAEDSVVEKFGGSTVSRENEVQAMLACQLINSYLLDLSKQLVNGLPFYDAMKAVISGKAPINS